MNNDAVINRIAHTTGCSRKEVLDTLKRLGMLHGRKNILSYNTPKNGL